MTIQSKIKAFAQNIVDRMKPSKKNRNTYTMSDLVSLPDHDNGSDNGKELDHVSTLWTKSTLLFTLFQVVSFVCVMTVLSWLVLNSNDSASGSTAQVLAVCCYLALSLLIIAVVTATDDVKMALFLSLSMAPLFSWCSIATLLNFLSIN